MSTTTSPEDITRLGLRDLVHDRLLEILLTGEISPGERVSIDGLARRLNVSPTPIREALVDLERTGLVVREALRGYRVAPPLDREQLAELCEARETVEARAARLATPADAGFLAQLRTLQAAHEEAGRRVATARTSADAERDHLIADAQDYFHRDQDFHEAILARCGNRYLVQMSHGLGAQIHRLRQTLPHGVTDVDEAVAEHQAIIDAFASADPDAPEEAMRTHIRNVAARALAENEEA
ncbi:GntR family transcriptional regulator [Brevibacterium sp.]|uniref:GntR family transcriptional regulator n=1 Tax=Brevibacterium sp. TaxID=1701 RepID=UPI002811A5E4|nr:GntR family transcriptional regulator [Brevibacterium sp.]